MRDKRRSKSWETAKLVRTMEARGLNSEQLAEQAGVSVRDLQNLLSDCHTGRPLRTKLNAFFGEPIFNLEYQRKPGRPRKSPAAPCRCFAPVCAQPGAPGTQAAQSKGPSA
jgi:hypothetical protein